MTTTSHAAFALALAAAALASTAGPARADDAYDSEPLPPLTARPDHAWRAESATIRLDDRGVSVDLRLHAMPAARSAAETGIAWQSDAVSWSATPQPYPEHQFPELGFDLDDAPAPTTQDVQVLLGNDDLTALVLATRLDPWAITHTPPYVDRADTAATTASAQAWDALVQRHAIEDSPPHDLAKWTARRKVDVPLSAASEHRLRVHYDARRGHALVPASQFGQPPLSTRYCLSPASLKLLAQWQGDAPGLAVESFAIPAGLDGAAPRDVTLELGAGAAPAKDPAAALTRYFACGAGTTGLATTAPLARGRVRADAQGVVWLLKVGVAGTSPR